MSLLGRMGPWLAGGGPFSGSSLASGLVQYWRLNADSINSVSSTNGTDTAVSYASAGILGNCATFNGSTSKIVTPGWGITGATARTLSFWIKRGASTAQNYACGSIGSATAFTNFLAFINTVSVGDVYLYISGMDYYIPGGHIVTSGFKHVIITYSGGALSTSTIQFYINNVLVACTLAGAGSGSLNSTDVSGAIGNIAFNGSVDEVGYWSRVITSAERAALYNGGAGFY